MSTIECKQTLDRKKYKLHCDYESHLNIFYCTPQFSLSESYKSYKYTSMKVYARDIYYFCRNFELNFGMTASAKVYDNKLNINFAENMAVY